MRTKLRSPTVRDQLEQAVFSPSETIAFVGELKGLSFTLRPVRGLMQGEVWHGSIAESAGGGSLLTVRRSLPWVGRAWLLAVIVGVGTMIAKFYGFVAQIELPVAIGILGALNLLRGYSRARPLREAVRQLFEVELGLVLRE